MSVELSLHLFTFSEWSELLDAFARLIEVLVSLFGRSGTIVLILVTVIGSIIYRRVQEKRRERVYELLSEEKERTIERLSRENLSLRIVVFKEIAHWTDEELERFLVHNRFDEAIDPRRALTSEHIARTSLAGEEPEFRQLRDEESPSNEGPPERGEV